MPPSPSPLQLLSGQKAAHVALQSLARQKNEAEKAAKEAATGDRSAARV